MGMIASNLISFFIIALTAVTIFQAGGADIETLRDAALRATTARGTVCIPSLCTGHLGSGLLAIPVLAGSAAYVVAELMGWPASAR